MCSGILASNYRETGLLYNQYYLGRRTGSLWMLENILLFSILMADISSLFNISLCVLIMTSLSPHQAHLQDITIC